MKGKQQRSLEHRESRIEWIAKKEMEAPISSTRAKNTLEKSIFSRTSLFNLQRVKTKGKRIIKGDKKRTNDFITIAGFVVSQSHVIKDSGDTQASTGNRLHSNSSETSEWRIFYPRFCLVHCCGGCSWGMSRAGEVEDKGCQVLLKFHWKHCCELNIVENNLILVF